MTYSQNNNDGKDETQASSAAAHRHIQAYGSVEGRQLNKQKRSTADQLGPNWVKNTAGQFYKMKNFNLQ